MSNYGDTVTVIVLPSCISCNGSWLAQAGVHLIEYTTMSVSIVDVIDFVGIVF